MKRESSLLMLEIVDKTVPNQGPVSGFQQYHTAFIIQKKNADYETKKAAKVGLFLTFTNLCFFLAKCWIVLPLVFFCKTDM